MHGKIIAYQASPSPNLSPSPNANADKGSVCYHIKTGEQEGLVSYKFI